MSALDIFVILLIGGGALIGFVRGLVHELFSLLAWVVAIVMLKLFHTQLAGGLGGQRSPREPGDLKHVCKSGGESGLYGDHVNRTAEIPGHGCDATAGNPAGHDEGKWSQIHIRVQGKSMSRNPLRNPHPNRSDFFYWLRSDPDAGESVHTMADNPPLMKRSQNDLLQHPDIQFGAGAVLFQT